MNKDTTIQGSGGTGCAFPEHGDIRAEGWGGVIVSEAAPGEGSGGGIRNEEDNGW